METFTKLLEWTFYVMGCGLLVTLCAGVIGRLFVFESDPDTEEHGPWAMKKDGFPQPSEREAPWFESREKRSTEE